MTYVGYWDRGTDYQAARGVVNTAPADNGSYILTLESPRVRERREFYYDAANRAYVYVTDRTQVGSRSRRLVVTFEDRANKPLRPWERESFTFSLENTTLSLEAASGAYRYATTFTTDPADPTTVNVRMTPGAKLLTAPDRNGVTMELRSTATGLRLVISDRWAAEYAGENLEVAVVVKKVKRGLFARDPVVLDVRQGAPLAFPAAATINHDFAGQGAGEYYIHYWYFRRAGSAISSEAWVSLGRGPNVTK